MVHQRLPLIELSTSALQYNFNQVRKLAPQSGIIAMVKADAYGHGIAFAVNALAPLMQENDAFGVACFDEAMQIRALGYQQRITLIEGVFNVHEWQQAAEQKFDCVVHQQQQVNWALKHPTLFQQYQLKIWLKVNTGMNRLGMSLEQAYQNAIKLKEAGFDIVLCMHFANADEPDHPLNQQQINIFLKLKTQLEPIQASVCNSAALYNWPKLHFDYVRPGIMLYGASPFNYDEHSKLDIKPVMQFSSSIIAMHQLEDNQYIGYGATYKTDQATTIGIVAMGYGDGYPRSINPLTYVLVGNFKATISGRISMDMMAIDLTHAKQEISIGTKVILWGNNPTVSFVAQENNTISYELFCRLTNRPKRIVINE